MSKKKLKFVNIEMDSNINYWCFNKILCCKMLFSVSLIEIVPANKVIIKHQTFTFAFNETNNSPLTIQNAL